MCELAKRTLLHRIHLSVDTTNVVGTQDKCLKRPVPASLEAAMVVALQTSGTVSGKALCETIEATSLTSREHHRPRARRNI